MAGVKDMAENFIDWITGGVSEDPFSSLQDEVEGNYQYPMEDNVAKVPEYVSRPIKKQKTKDNVVEFQKKCMEQCLSYCY